MLVHRKAGESMWKVTELKRMDDGCGPPCDECHQPIEGLHIHLRIEGPREQVFIRGFCSEGCALKHTSGMRWPRVTVGGREV